MQKPSDIVVMGVALIIVLFILIAILKAMGY